MPQYKVTIDGYESGLTTRTVEQQFREQYGAPEIEIEVTEVEQ